MDPNEGVRILGVKSLCALVLNLGWIGDKVMRRNTVRRYRWLDDLLSGDSGDNEFGIFSSETRNVAREVTLRI